LNYTRECADSMTVCTPQTTLFGGGKKIAIAVALTVPLKNLFFSNYI